MVTLSFSKNLPTKDSGANLKKMDNKYALYRLPEQRHNGIFTELSQDLAENSFACDKPKILIISGQPGAGKTALSDALKAVIFENSASIAVINGDDYREMHPQCREIFLAHDKEYAQYTDPDARLWTKELLQWAADNKRNIIFESTLRNREPINTTIREIKAKGYEVHIALLAVPKEITRTNIVLRYENAKANPNAIARWTSFEAHEEAYRNIPNTIDYLERNNSCIDSIRIFEPSSEKPEKSLKEIYNSAASPGNLAKQHLLCSRIKELAAEEKNALVAKQKKILELMAQRKASAKEAEEIQAFFRGRISEPFTAN